MPRTGENTYKRKDGRWEARFIKGYDANGKAKYGYLYARTYAEVKQKLIAASSDCGITGSMKPVSSLLFQSVANEWLQNMRMRVKESSFSRYKRSVDNHINPFLGNYPIRKISTELIQEHVNNLLMTGRLDGKGGLSSKTTNDILTILKSIFEYERQKGYTVICNLDLIRIKKSETNIRILSKKEQDLLKNHLFEEMDRMNLGILLSLYTGIRIGELCALRWENLNSEDKVLKVRHTLQRIPNLAAESDAKTKIIITSPKSKSSNRDIPLPDFLISLITPMTEAPTAFVLTGEKNKFIEPRTVQYRFDKVINVCGISKISFHALRHTFATRSVELGFEIKSLSEILGHSHINITLERYVHSFFSLKRDNMDKLFEIF